MSDTSKAFVKLSKRVSIERLKPLDASGVILLLHETFENLVREGGHSIELVATSGIASIDFQFLAVRMLTEQELGERMQLDDEIKEVARKLIDLNNKKKELPELFWAEDKKPVEPDPPPKESKEHEDDIPF